MNDERHIPRIRALRNSKHDSRNKKKSIDDLEYNLRHSQREGSYKEAANGREEVRKCKAQPRRFDNGLMEVSEKRGNKERNEVRNEHIRT